MVLSAIEPTGEEVAQALSHVLSWPEIARSSQLAKFLQYIVERTLAGDTQSIKAYSIAVDVLGRPADFDPQTDPIVRVQARRLRGLLEQFYLGPGAGDAVRIELPVGRYVPVFRSRDKAIAATVEADEPAAAVVVEPQPTTSWRGGLGVSWFVLAVLSISAALLAYGFSAWGQRNEDQPQMAGLLDFPHVSVLEFQNLTGESQEAAHSSGLAVELVSALQKFENFTVSYGGNGAEAVSSEGSDYLLSGIVRRDEGVLQFSSILTEAESRTVVWSMTVETGETLPRVSVAISRSLGSPRGPLHREARALLGSSAVNGGETLYLCQVLFDLYREKPSQALAAQAENCFGALGQRERATGRVIASLATLAVEAGIGESLDDADRAARLAEADAAMANAIQAAPVSSFVWEMRARLYETMGLNEAAEGAFASALQLNPANTDALAAWARHLALGGRLADATQFSQQAIDSAPEPPAWYMGVPALVALRQGDFAGAVGFAERYSEADHELGPILAVVAGQQAGNRNVVNAYLPRVLEVPEFRARGVLTRLADKISDAGLLDIIGASLVRAGVPATSLTAPF